MEPLLRKGGPFALRCDVFLSGFCSAVRCGVGARGYPHTETRSPLLPPFTPRTWPSASEDLAVDDVPHEDPPVGAFEVTLGALHLDSNDANALASGWGVPRALEGDVELPVAEDGTGKEEAGALERAGSSAVRRGGEGARSPEARLVSPLR